MSSALRIMLITHDLGVIAELAERVVVMYAGKIVEQADVKPLFANPLHPYTVGLLGSIPKLTEQQDRLQVIEGVVPHPAFLPKGCRFHPGAKKLEEICKVEEPELMEQEPGHLVACWKYTEFRRLKEVG